MKTPIRCAGVDTRTKVIYNIIYNQFASGKSRFSLHAKREKMLRSALAQGKQAPRFAVPDHSKKIEISRRQASQRIKRINPALREEVSAQEASSIFERLTKMQLGFNFPDAYCYDRAHVMALELERMGIRSNKVLIHGSGEEKVRSASGPELWGQGKDIWAPTSNHPSGWVIWQTHIAPAIKVKGQRELMVLDPSVARVPVPASRWKAMMNAPFGAKLFSFAGHKYKKEDKNTGWSVETVAQTLRNVANNRVMEKARASVLDKLRRLRSAPQGSRAPAE